MSRRGNTQADMVLRAVMQDDGVREFFHKLGPDGKKAYRQLQMATKDVQPGLKAVDDVMGDIQSSADRMLDRLGPVGTALRGLGPVGFAAGAAIGASVLALERASAAGEDAILTLADLSRTADRLDLDPELFQAVRLELERFGIANTTADATLSNIKKNFAEATIGTGEFYSTIKQINPELAEQIRNTRSFSDQLDLARQAYQQTNDEQDRYNILVRSGGDGNVEATKRLFELNDSLTATTEGMKNQGLIISGDLLPAYERMAEQITADSQRTEMAWLRLKAQMSDLGLSRSQISARTAEFFVGLFPPATLQDEIANLTAKLERQKEAASGFGGDGFAGTPLGLFFRNYDAAAQETQAELDRLLAKQRQVSDGAAAFAPGFDLADQRPTGPIDDTPRETESERAARLAELTAARARAAQVLASLGDITGLVARKESELDALVAKGLLTRDQATAALTRFETRARSQTEAARALAEAEKTAAEVRIQLMSDSERIQSRVAERARELRDAEAAGLITRDQLIQSLRTYRQELDGTDQAKRDLAAALIDTLDPMERLGRDLAELERQQALANLPAEEFNRILEARKQITREQTERDQFGETLDEAEARIRQAAMSAEAVIDAKVEAERAVLDALGDRLSDVEVEAYLEKFETGLREAAEAGRDFAGAGRLIDDALDGNIRTLGDLEDAALDVFATLIKQALLSRDALGGIFGGGSFGQALTSAVAGVFHDGTHTPTRPKRTRRITASTRIGTDEALTVLRKRERVFSESDNRDLIAAIRAPVMARIALPRPVVPPLDLSGFLPSPAAQPQGSILDRVTIINSTGQPVEQSETVDADGSRRLRVMIGRQAREAAASYNASPAGRKQMRELYGLKAKPVGRVG